ncbi:MAG: leucyl aminopeptidase [Planctomycetaceae bacterium]
MNVCIESTPWTAAAGDALIVFLPESFEQTGQVAALDQALGGQIGRLRELHDFAGKPTDCVTLPAPVGIAANRLLLVGVGPADQLSEGALYKAAMIAARAVSTKKTERVAAVIPTSGPGGFSLSQRVQIVTTAIQVGSVGQDLYRAEKKRFPLVQLDLLLEPGVDAAEPAAAAARGTIVADAINLARELVNLPAKVIYPASFAERARQLAEQHGVSCETLDQTALEREKMGSLLAVAAGSDQPPRLVCLEYNGAPPGAPLLGLVGKGVTFDSGGLSIKNNDNMLTMKCDMAGAATVLATVIAIARLKLPVRVIGLMGLVENMTGGSAMKLGDVLTARSGVTIEVQNTDAEGRLVLADVLDYALSKGADYLIDLATLTGACVVALGEDVTGAMTNNQPWCDRLLAAAKCAGEELWQLPMFGLYDELIKSEVADIRNVGGRWGGAITAAKFLERFVKDRPWVHLDIAGPAFASADKPHREGGATGCMVRTLVELARGFTPT